MIRGIEFRWFHDSDIMGFRVTQLCDHKDPGKVIDHIHNCGGIAVWAHPAHHNYPIENAWLRKLDGVEIWNQIHDSRFIPYYRPVGFFLKLLKSNSDLKAFSGLDMHNGNNYFYLSTVVFAEDKNRNDILTALGNGAFGTRGRFSNIDCSADIFVFYYIYIHLFNYLINIARWIRDLFIHEH